MTDKIKITGPNRLVLMDVILGALAKQQLDVDVDCEEEFLSCDEITRRLDSNGQFTHVHIEVVES